MLVSGCCPNALCVPVSIGMLVVAYLYEEDCKIEAVPFFLFFGGWILSSEVSCFSALLTDSLNLEMYWLC